LFAQNDYDSVCFDCNLFVFFIYLDKHPYWNNVPTTERTTIEDAPQLEYDDHHIDLIADRGK
jgi:hypothetical protein